MSSTNWTPTSTRRPGVVTVIPDDDGPAKWFEEHPALTIGIAVSILVLFIGFIFCWIRKRRKKSEEAAQKNEEKSVESRPSQAETTISVPEFTFYSDSENRQSFSTSTKRPSNSEEPYGESYIIIGNPSGTNPRTQTRRYHKTKRKSLAMPPGFYVSNRRKSIPTIAPENELRPPRISFARWSTAGLEIHDADMNDSRIRASSVPTVSKKLSIPDSPNYVVKVPMVLRRVSQGQDHIIYATEPLRTPRGSNTTGPEQTRV